MKDLKKIICCLGSTPEILKSLLTKIDSELYKKSIISDKWSIHEHACHLAVGDKFGFLKRIKLFIDEDTPTITPLSGESFPVDFFINMDLKSALEEFIVLRKKVLKVSNNIEYSLWDKEGDHPEYKIYTPYIMIRHLLMHDFYHLYKIEELWLTKDFA